MIRAIRSNPPSVTPWGALQDSRETLPGVWWVSTAGHGGYWLTVERAAQVRKAFPATNGRQWYEEDCEWALVDLALQAEIQDDAAIHHAVETVLMCSGWDFCKDRWAPFKTWIESKAGAECMERFNRHAAAVAGKWRRGSLCTIRKRDYERRGLTVPPDKCWEVGMSRGGEHKIVIMPYPQHEYWTDEEIAAVEFIPEPLRQEPVPVVRFSESECGGVFDGFTVTSDADPGL